MSALFESQLAVVDAAVLHELRGTVQEVRGLAVRVANMPAPIGAMVSIGSQISGEVVGFDGDETIVMPLGAVTGVRRGDRVIAQQFDQTVAAGDVLLGRVIDGLGRPIDGKGPIVDADVRPLNPDPLDPMSRKPIDEPITTGIRAIDALHTLGRGQRIGIFSPPGVGKSTLLAMCARNTDADVSVIAMVGERGREVRDFIDHQLGPEGLARSVVVCATGDEPALLRIRAAMVASAVAEHFRDQGKDVLLLMDSVTRFCQAQRQVGLSAGEPPATRGYPPSVFAMLPVLLERSGRTEVGSITGMYAVLVEGDEMTDPVTDSARGILDGHIMLSRELASQGHWPAINVLDSISRIAPAVMQSDQQAARKQVLRLVHSYGQVQDLLNIGAYAAGSSEDFDLAIACKPAIDQLLQQGMNEDRNGGDIERTCKQLFALTAHIDQQKQLMRRPAQRGAQGPRATSPASA